MSTELLPCPYCGSTESIPAKHATQHAVMCLMCKAMGPNMPSKEKAIAAWNRRFVCPDKNGKKVFAGDSVRLKTSHYYYKGIVTWRVAYADWIVLGLDDSVGWGIRPDIIELIESDGE